MRLIVFLLMALGFIHFSANAQVDSNGLPINIEGVPRKVHQVPVKEIKDPLAVYEDSLIYFADSLSIGDEAGKLAAAQYMIRLMRPVLRSKASFNYPFTRLKNRINILDTKRKHFRIYNWEYTNNAGDTRYYGVVQFSNGKFYPLIDVASDVLRTQEDTILSDKKWFGASYYNIVELETPKGINYYVLGYSQGTANSRKKIVECFNIIGDSAIVFGAPVFESPVYKNKLVKRFILEYNTMSAIGCNWDADRQMIVYDHLESSIGDLKKRYTFVPDGTYDGLTWDGKHWRVSNNVVQFEDFGRTGAPTDGKTVTPRQFAPQEPPAPTPPPNNRR
jgi:hypothetical protein